MEGEPMSDLIDRRAAIDALWKALYEYEDKTEKQFQESEDLDVGDWIVHRGFVQNMSDIDRQTILNLPSAQPDRRKGKWEFIGYQVFVCTACGACYSQSQLEYLRTRETDPEFPDFCPMCGADMRGVTNA